MKAAINAKADSIRGGKKQGGRANAQITKPYVLKSGLI